MPKHKLTAKAIERWPAVAKRTEIADAMTPGLYLIVQPSGSKSWAFRGRHEGRNYKLTLGHWPAMSLADARAAALAHVNAPVVHADGCSDGPIYCTKLYNNIDQKWCLTVRNKRATQGAMYEIKKVDGLYRCGGAGCDSLDVAQAYLAAKKLNALELGFEYYAPCTRWRDMLCALREVEAYDGLAGE